MPNFTFGEMQNLQLSNCKNNMVKKHIFTPEYSQFNSSFLCRHNMVIITFHDVLILTMNCAILTIIFYTSLHGWILPCDFSLCTVMLKNISHFSLSRFFLYHGNILQQFIIKYLFSLLRRAYTNFQLEWPSKIMSMLIL